MILSFTGHRLNKVGPHGAPIVKALLDALRHFQPDHAISGMAIGVDQWAAACCNYLRIPWTAAVPFKGQERLWPPSGQVEYHRLLATAQETSIVCGAEIDPIKAMQVRNEWMVDRADMVLGVWDGSRGGTANCIRYAKLMGKPICRISPHPRKGWGYPVVEWTK